MRIFSTIQSNLMRNIIICILWIGSYNLVYSQVFNISSYTTDDGLIQSQVRSMLQDSRGFLWFGTHRGISQFDGKKFINYTDKDGLSGNFVSTIYEDKDGDLWFGTDQGLNHYDGQQFNHYQYSHENINVTAITQDKDGSILLGTKNRGIISFSINDNSFNELTHINADVTSPFTIHTFFSDREGNIWVGANKGLFQYTHGQLAPQPLPVNTEINCILIDSDGYIWLGTGIGVFQYRNHEFQQLGLLEELPHETVYAITEDLNGNVWFGTGKGVAYYDGKNVNNVKRNDNLLSYRMRSALTDTEGNLWLGTDGGGIRKVTRGIFRHYDVMDGMTSNIAKSFLEDDKGNIWISTFDQGINILGENGFTAFYDETNGLGGNDISFSYEDSQGNFWFASYTQGLTKYDGQRFVHYTKDDGLISDVVFSIAEHPEGYLLIGTDNGISIYKEEEFEDFALNGLLIDQTIYAILHDSNNKLWFGTPIGTTVINGDSVSHFPAPEFSGTTIISILESPDKRVWLASSDGMTIFEGDEHYRLKVSEASGANSIVSMAFDPNHFLWIGTENGAYKLNLTDFRPPELGVKVKFEHYTRKDGLPSMECNANAIFNDREGNTWLGTSGGAVVNPSGVERQEIDHPPFIHITSVRTPMQKTWKELGYEIDKVSGLPLNPVLPHSTNRLEFEFIGISLNNPNQVEYRFRLDGLDTEWSSPTRQTSVAYSNLSPNTYTFRVIAKKESENWNESNSSQFIFTIKPAIYQTLWFRSFVLLFIIGISYLIVRQITAEKRRKREEQAVKDKAEKLQLEHQALYAMMNPHFTFNALQSIQYFIHSQDRIKANKFLSSFAKLIRKNLESTRTDFISLQEEVDRLGLYLSLEQMRFPEKFTYHIEVSADIDPYTTLLPPMILQPFVENSIKHGIMPLQSGGNVSIDIQPFQQDYLTIIIEDNGIGIETSKRINASRPRDHVSRGMQITMDRLALFARMTAKKFNVNIEELVNKEGNVSGTRVSLLLPFHF